MVTRRSGIVAGLSTLLALSSVDSLHASHPSSFVSQIFETQTLATRGIYEPSPFWGKAGSLSRKTHAALVGLPFKALIELTHENGMPALEESDLAVLHAYAQKADMADGVLVFHKTRKPVAQVVVESLATQWQTFPQSLSLLNEPYLWAGVLPSSLLVPDFIFAEKESAQANGPVPRGTGYFPTFNNNGFINGRLGEPLGTLEDLTRVRQRLSPHGLTWQAVEDILHLWLTPQRVTGIYATRLPTPSQAELIHHYGAQGLDWLTKAIILFDPDYRYRALTFNPRLYEQVMTPLKEDPLAWVSSAREFAQEFVGTLDYLEYFDNLSPTQQRMARTKQHVTSLPPTSPYIRRSL